MSDTETNIPTVHLSKLCTSGAGFHDRTFEMYVRRFMADYMPCFPLDILDTQDVDKWELTPNYKVVEVDCELDDINKWVFTCEGEEVSKSVAEECLEHMEDHYKFDGGEFSKLGDARGTRWDAGAPDTLYVVVDGAGDVANYAGAVTEDEDGAREVADTAESESREAFPWMWNTVWLPDNLITDDDLQQAGFEVAQYTSQKPSGATRFLGSVEYRVCGIDAAGYDFASSFFSRLCAIVHENRTKYGWTVETDNGPVFITTKAPE